MLWVVHLVMRAWIVHVMHLEASSPSTILATVCRGLPRMIPSNWRLERSLLARLLFGGSGLRLVQLRSQIDSSLTHLLEVAIRSIARIVTLVWYDRFIETVFVHFNPSILLLILTIIIIIVVWLTKWMPALSPPNRGCTRAHSF